LIAQSDPLLDSSFPIDSDGDGISDARERELGLNPNSNDSDGDGILDSKEIGDINNPTDTDGDGIIDALDEDSDGDGISDEYEREAGTDPRDNNDYPREMSNEEKAMFQIIMNRSNTLNQEVDKYDYLKIPTIIMIEALKRESEKK